MATWEPTHDPLKSRVRKRLCSSFPWRPPGWGNHSQWSRQTLHASGSSTLESIGGSERNAEGAFQGRGGPGAVSTVNPRRCSVPFLPGVLG